MAFRSILIAGAGTMGRGIAELVALAGFEVQLWDHFPSQLGRASAAIEKALRKQKAIGRISENQFNLTLERIRLISDLKIAHSKTDLVIESVVEDMEIKKSLFSEIERHIPNAWFISHTSSLSIEGLASGLKRPERLIGMHFFNPAPVMPLVEIVYSIRTDKAWVQNAVKLAEHDLGKQTIVVRDSPGFASSRLGTSIALEAMRMVEDRVASIEDIDKAMEFGYRHPMGPLRQSDWIGLDVRLKVAQVLYRELKSEAFKPPRLLEEMVAQGKLGKKSGEGFYKWPKES
ncbi:MAG: 3-hydroxyacyl-CoA dehydrogenase family protein [Bdellovibrionota bacterium]